MIADILFNHRFVFQLDYDGYVFVCEAHSPPQSFAHDSVHQFPCVFGLLFKKSCLLRSSHTLTQLHTRAGKLNGEGGPVIVAAWFSFA